MGLSINENKTKYMRMSPTQINRQLQNLSLEDHNFEAVREFTYLGVTTRVSQMKTVKFFLNLIY
jgi:hypothetical protein